MPQELQFESHLNKKFALLILTLITRHTPQTTTQTLNEELKDPRLNGIAL